MKMENKYLGLDIGGTSAKFGLVDHTGNILYSKQYSVAFDDYKTPILDTVIHSTDDFCRLAGIPSDKLSGIGISATGQIDSMCGIITGSGGNIANWEGTSLKESFAEKFHLPVTVVNDANCVALGEKWIGAAKNRRNVIVLTIGTGLGGGIIIDNKILLGQFGYGGEIGHFSINNTGLPCTCGNTGCFEQYASMTALIKSVTDYYETTAPSYLLNHKIDGKSIFDSVASGNSDIIKIVDSWIHDISCGIVSLIHIFNPEIVLIGGGVCVQKELFINKLRKSVFGSVMPNFRQNLTLQSAALGNNAGLIGAVYYLIRKQIENN